MDVSCHSLTFTEADSQKMSMLYARLAILPVSDNYARLHLFFIVLSIPDTSEPSFSKSKAMRPKQLNFSTNYLCLDLGFINDLWNSEGRKSVVATENFNPWVCLTNLIWFKLLCTAICVTLEQLMSKLCTGFGCSSVEDDLM